jgi:hypothetical protein
MIVLPVFRPAGLAHARSGFRIAAQRAGHPNLASFVFCAGVSSIALASMALCAFSLRKISIRREIGRDAMRNSAPILPVVVRNQGFLTRQAILLRERESFTGDGFFDTVVDPLMPGETRVVQRMPLARRRGRFQLSNCSSIGGDPADSSSASAL